jgi:hypothetical protein
MIASLEPISASVKNTAALTGESPWSVRNHVRLGHYKAKRDGKKLLIIVASVREYVKNLPDAVLGAGQPVERLMEGQRRKRQARVTR